MPVSWSLYRSSCFECRNGNKSPSYQQKSRAGIMTDARNNLQSWAGHWGSEASRSESRGELGRSNLLGTPGWGTNFPVGARNRVEHLDQRGSRFRRRSHQAADRLMTLACRAGWVFLYGSAVYFGALVVIN